MLHSHKKKNAAFEVHIHKATSPVNIDGIVNEDAWQEAEAADSFFMVLPMDTSAAEVKTDVRVTYDDRYFYLLSQLRSTEPPAYIVPSHCAPSALAPKE